MGKIRKILSGGQTGADQAALRAAKALGLETGGWCPAKHRTEYGSMPDLERVYGLRPHVSGDYPPRTRLNAHDADITLWFGHQTSRGFHATRNACALYRKPFFINPTRQEVFALAQQYEVFNVAGNSESHQPGIGEQVELFLIRALRG